MSGRWAVIWIGMSVLSMSARTQELKPQDGFRVTSQMVHLAEAVPVPCVAVAAQRTEATIVLSRTELEGLAAVRTRVDNSEPARLAFITGDRARALLKQIGPARDAHGCQVVQGTVPLDPGFLVGKLLEQGHATVFTKRLNLPEPVVEVRHVDTELNGREEFRLLDGTVIWSYGVWVSW